MAELRRALVGVRAATQLAPVRPAWAAGLRAAIATVAPLAAAHAFGLSGGTWLSLAGFTGALADKGGSYRARAATMGALALAAAVAAALGTWAGASLTVAVPLAFLVALAAGLARAWGEPGVSVGGAALVIFVIALAFPEPALAAGLERGAWVFAGELWAMFVALVLWPLRPYRPARLAVAECYRALAAYVAGIAAAVRGPGAAEALPTPVAGSVALRQALEHARGVLAAMRRGRSGESERGERLLVLREAVDQLFGHLLALADTLDAIPPAERDRLARTAVVNALDALGATATQLADAVAEERGRPVVAVEWDGGPLRAAAAAAPPLARAAYEHTAILLDRLTQYATVAAATVATLNEGGPIPALAPRVEIADPSGEPTPFARLRTALAPDSVILRYALRLALVTALAVWLTSLFGLRRGYWVTITVVIILQPYTGVTAVRALQRVVGTVLGGVLTAALGALLHDPVAILPVVFVFALVSVALLPLNYAVFSVFLTPTFVLLAEATAGDWHLARVRIVNTILGGGLAFLGARLLWPSPESDRAPANLAATLRANRAYLELVISLFGDTSDAAGLRLRTARRSAALAALNAEESLQRLLTEHEGRGEELAPVMTFLTYTRRFIASVAALAAFRFAPDAPPPERLAPLGRAVADVLDDLAAALLDRRPPAPLLAPEDAEALGAGLAPLARARVDRIARQLRSLHDSVERWMGEGSRAGAVAAADPAPEPLGRRA